MSDSLTVEKSWPIVATYLVSWATLLRNDFISQFTRENLFS